MLKSWGCLYLVPRILRELMQGTIYSDFPWPWGMIDDKPLCTLAAEQTGATAGGPGDNKPLLWVLAVPLQHGEK